MNQNPAFYVSKPGEVGLVYNYGWYAVFTVGELLIIDRRQDKFGNVYSNSSDLTEIGGITTDLELYTLLADGLITQIKTPFFVVWEIGQEKPLDPRYFSFKYAFQKAHALAVSEPLQTTKEKTNV